MFDEEVAKYFRAKPSHPRPKARVQKASDPDDADNADLDDIDS